MTSDAETQSAESERLDQTWRDNWIVKNWLTAAPFVGGFFKTSNIKEATNHLGHYSFMLAGGTTLMILEVLPMSMDDSPAVKHLKMTTNMAIGMAVGEMCYNTLFSIGKAVASQLPCSAESDEQQTRSYRRIP